MRSNQQRSNKSNLVSGTHNRALEKADSGIAVVQLTENSTWQKISGVEVSSQIQMARDAGIMAPLPDFWTSGIINPNWEIIPVENHRTIGSLMHFVNYICMSIEYQTLKPCWFFRDSKVPEIKNYSCVHELSILSATTHHVNNLLLNVCGGSIAMDAILMPHWRDIIGFRFEMAKHPHIRLRIWVTSDSAAKALTKYLEENYDRMTIICNDLKNKYSDKSS